MTGSLHPPEQPQVFVGAPALPVLVLAGLGLGAGAAVGSLGAAIGITSARQELGLILRFLNTGQLSLAQLADSLRPTLSDDFFH